MGIDRKWPKTPNLITWGDLMVIFFNMSFLSKKGDPPLIWRKSWIWILFRVLQGRCVQNFISYLVVFTEKIDKMWWFFQCDVFDIIYQFSQKIRRENLWNFEHDILGGPWTVSNSKIFGRVNFLWRKYQKRPIDKNHHILSIFSENTTR
jgi:hypothetical protein